jgi:hypothetical protein
MAGQQPGARCAAREAQQRTHRLFSDPAPKAPDTSDSHRGILAYRVDRTDTIESIATQFTTTPAQIREMNRLNADSILKAGDEIMVPAMGAVSVSSR